MTQLEQAKQHLLKYREVLNLSGIARRVGISTQLLSESLSNKERLDGYKRDIPKSKQQLFIDLMRELGQL